MATRTKPFDGFAAADMVEVRHFSSPVGSKVPGVGAWYPFGRVLHDMRPGEMTRADWLKSYVKPAKLKYTTDGLSKTVLIGEMAGAPQPVPSSLSTSFVDRFKAEGKLDRYGQTWSSWINHQEMFRHERRINVRNMGSLFSFHRGGINASMCDGSVRFVDEQIDENVLHLLLTRSDHQLDY